MSRSQLLAVCHSTRVITPSARARANNANQQQLADRPTAVPSRSAINFLLGPLVREGDDDDDDFVASTVASSTMSFLGPDESRISNAEVCFPTILTTPSS